MSAWVVALAMLAGGDEIKLASAPGTLAASPLQQRVLSELNRARGAPQAFSEDLVRFRGYFRDGLIHFPNNPVAMISREGTAAVDEAVEFTRAQRGIPALTLSPVLTQAAQDHADFLAGGHVGHDGEGGSNPSDRVVRRGGGRYVAEIISFGYDDATDVVRQFIVDDGVPNRGHRDMLYRANFRYAGVACGSHLVYRATCVVTLAATPDGR